MITCKNDRLLELLWFVGYCIEFPTQLAVRIGGGPEWNRRVMYRAIHEGYVKLYRRKYKRHVVRSMSLTEKGFDYVAQRDPEALSMIYSRLNRSERVYPSWVDKILRLHAVAIGTVMAHAAGAEITLAQKPSLMSPKKRPTNSIPPDPTKAYYYASHESSVSIRMRLPRESYEQMKSLVKSKRATKEEIFLLGLLPGSTSSSSSVRKDSSRMIRHLGLPARGPATMRHAHCLHYSSGKMKDRRTLESIE